MEPIDLEIKYRYTKHQVARGTRSDAELHGMLYLIKGCSTLRLTYQIRLLTYQAAQRHIKLTINVPKLCKIQPCLRDFQREHATTIRIQKV